MSLFVQYGLFGRAAYHIRPRPQSPEQYKGEESSEKAGLHLGFPTNQWDKAKIIHPNCIADQKQVQPASGI